MLSLWDSSSPFAWYGWYGYQLRGLINIDFVYTRLGLEDPSWGIEKRATMKGIYIVADAKVHDDKLNFVMDTQKKTL